eukprot:CAMPEP_0180507006 /NCGR_PEP_ID=MMETSP1036_2-20121128/48327_1 /TAXON_ID=632150 /ORGANISM="Azadinium spinosum, Strain 3D9" /LENGTH=44 /DNA_ID= /DNA_START= /DNA_END= /DNA_ORIENTATION=
MTGTSAEVLSTSCSVMVPNGSSTLFTVTGTTMKRKPATFPIGTT